MGNIDDKVVAMSFEGSRFESGVAKTVAALEKLKSSLKFEGAAKGFNDLNNAGNKVNFSRMAAGIEDIKNRLGALRLAAIAAFSQMAMRAVSAGLQFAKSFTIAPIMQGLDIYQTKLQSIQTVLANTAAQGTKMSDVTAALNELNKYSNQTIYNFGQMAKNIGTFTAAGVDLKTATASIKGIANLAALSGSSADQASMAMYQLSQAIAAGRINLQDWNSVVNAGMGGAVFQKALANTAVAMGTLKKGAVQLVGPMKQLKVNGDSFRQSIAAKGGKTWLTSDVLTTALKTFTGDLSAAQLKAQGFNAEQIKSIQQTAKLALHAATQVKTLGQAFDIAKETIATGWASTFEIVFGNINQAKTLFTGLSNAMNGIIQRSADARNKLLKDWAALGGRTVLINGIKDAFKALGEILKPIKQAFHDIFPPATGKSLYDLTVRFKQIADAMRPSKETVDNLRSTFRGLFAILDIGRQIVSGFFSMLGKLFHTAGAGQGSFLKFTATIGDFLVNLDMALKKGNVFHNVFAKIGNVLAVPIQMLEHLGQVIGNLFSGFSPGGFSGKMSSLAKSTEPFRTAIDNIAKAMQGLGPAISNALSNINWNAILQVVRTGLFAALVLMMKNFIGGTNLNQIFGIMGKNIGKNLGGGILGNLNKAFGGLSGTLSAMQNELKARTLEEIAVAIALLAASVLALSLVNPERLNSALGAMTVMFGELLGAMAILDKISNTKGMIKLPFVAASLILLAGAIDLLTISVLALSKLSWSQLSKGLIGVSVLLGGLAAASTVLSKNSAGMIRSGIGIMAIAVAMKILASALAAIGQMSWTEIGKGLTGVGVSLGAIAVAMQMMPKNMVLRSAAIVAIAAALELIANVMGKIGNMNWTQIGKGLAGIAGSLIAIATAMHLMPKNMILTAGGLLIVALSLGKIEEAVAKMGGMSLKQIAKGLIGLAGALVILAAGLTAMSGTLAGAAALGVAATGLALLLPAIVLMGHQSWGTLLKGLVGLGAALGIIAGAALLLSPSIPALLGFGAALVVIGAGLALAGAGIALIGVGLSAIAVSGTAAVGILVTALEQLVGSLVDIAKNLALGVLEIVKQFAAVAPQFTAALGVIINNLLDVVINAAPKIGQAFEALLLVALKILHDNQGKIIQAGFDLLKALLDGIANNIGALVTSVTNIIVNFINALNRNLNRIITAGQQLMISLIKGIVQSMTIVPTTVLQIITKFISTVASNLGKILTSGLSIITTLMKGIASKLGEVISLGTKIIVSWIIGIGNAGARIVAAGTDAMIKFINALVKASLKLIDAGAKAILTFLNGITAAVNTYSPQFRAAGLNLAFAIADGMSFGLLSKAKSLAEQAANIGHGIIGAMKSAVGAHSPSVEAFLIGGYIIQGLQNGMVDASKNMYASTTIIGKKLLQSIRDSTPYQDFYAIGAYLTHSFAQGLGGNKQDIQNAFTDLNSKLQEAAKAARDTISSEQDKIDQLMKAKKVDWQAVRDAQEVIKVNQDILNRSVTTHQFMVTVLRKQKTELEGLAIQYDTVSKKLQAAQDVLAQAIQTRDAAFKQYNDQYSTLPDITKTDPEGQAIDQLAAYEDALKHQTDAVAAYKDTLDQLRALGLDDATYQKLLSEGTADQEFANQLLAGGKTAVDGLNELDKQLAQVSKGLATNAANNLYQAGVDAATGLVKGLKARKKELAQAMKELAQDIIQAIKDELHIKSPSRVFMEIGDFAMRGLALGLTASSGIVEDAARNAMTSLKESLNNMTDGVGADMSLNPVITPILDLTQVKASAKQLTNLTDISSYAQASAIAAEHRTAAEELAAVAGKTEIKLEQNNYSPKALSEVEIYRNTRNQLSQLKTALAL